MYLGGPNGISTTPFAVLKGPHPDTATCSPDFFGGEVHAAGDVNGDGYGDVLVYASSGHKAYVYYGSATGMTTPPVVLTGGKNHTSWYLYQGASGAGDVNGDGFADVVLGSEQQGGPLPAVYLGSAAGLSTSPVYLQYPANTTLRPPVSVRGVGDVDGDGYADVVCFTGENSGSTAYYVYRGGASGIAVNPVPLPAPYGMADVWVAQGDVNGDGFSDVTAWSYWISSNNPIAEYFGTGAGLPASPSKSFSVSVASTFNLAQSLSSVGDVNRDGYADVVLGAEGETELFLGGPGGLLSTPVQTLTGSGNYGWATGGAGAGF